MADVKIILPDGSAKEYAAGTTLGEADSQYVDVEPSYKYTPTTVPAAEIPEIGRASCRERV